MSSAVATSSPGAESAAKQYASDKAAPLTHVLLVVITLVSLFFPVPPNINVILTASLAVFAGCWRSIKPEPSAASESMTKGEAMRFPLYGSMVLFGLFLAFKFLPKELVNMLLNFYIGLISVVVLTTSLLPYVIDYFPKGMQKKKFTFLKINIPALGIDTKTEPFTFSAAETVIFLISAIFCSWYIMKRHWVANNVLGLAMSLEGIEHLNLGSVHVGCILLVGLFIYDIFWVFCTPVMVSVAKNFDAPIKLLFPRALDVATGKRAFSMLGLGDIVIPGIFVALMLRMDVHSNFKKRYFYSAFFGYVLGLATTIVVMNVFNAAQPALLYIVPAVLGCVALHATIKGELMQVFNYSESDDSKQPKEAGADSKKDK